MRMVCIDVEMNETESLSLEYRADENLIFIYDKTTNNGLEIPAERFNEFMMAFRMIGDIVAHESYKKMQFDVPYVSIGGQRQAEVQK